MSRLPALALLSMLECGGGATQDSPAQTHGCPSSAGPRHALIVGSGAADDVEAVFQLVTTSYGMSGPEICVLVDDEATSIRVLSELETIALGPTKRAGLVYLAGPGTRRMDGGSEEPDRWDEGLVLADGQLWDDQVAAALLVAEARSREVALIVDAGTATGRGPDRDRFKQTDSAQDSGTDGDRVGGWGLAGANYVVGVSMGGDTSARQKDGRGVLTLALVEQMGRSGDTWNALSARVAPVMASLGAAEPVFTGDLSGRVLDGSDAVRPLTWTVKTMAGDQLALAGIPTASWGPGALVRVYPAGADAAELTTPESAKGTWLITSVDGGWAEARWLKDASGSPTVKKGDVAVLTQPAVVLDALPVEVLEGVSPDRIRPEVAEPLRRLIEDHPMLRLRVGEEPAFRVEGDPNPQIANASQIRGPEGALRTTHAVPIPADQKAKLLAMDLVRFARQRALLAKPGDPGTMGLDGDLLHVQMIANDKQEACAHAPMVSAPANTLQRVPACTRWQIQVSLKANAPAPLEVGGVILFNDGESLGFPVNTPAIRIEPGGSHRFKLPRPGVPFDGIRSQPPLDVTEHIVVYGTPVGAKVNYNELTDVTGRSLESVHPIERLLSGGLSGGRDVQTQEQVRTGRWTRTSLPYVIVSNAKPRPENASADPEERTRELTLDHFDIRPFLPANQDSYLYKVLQQAERLAEISESDGVDYAQCLGADSKRINNTSRFSTADWPDGECWSQPWDLTRDHAELTESPGIDCSTSMWFIYTRACKRDDGTQPPVQNAGEYHTAWQARLRTWHSEQRDCLLFTDLNWRAGFASTGIMSGTTTKNREIMARHWVSCLAEEPMTGDVLVTRNSRDTAGHTYMVIDPERQVVFGSHGGDLDWDKLTDEEVAEWASYEAANSTTLDRGAEYQFLAWFQKGDLKDSSLGKWGGFATERLKACWRHKKLIEEWELDPSSRPGSTQRTLTCRPPECLQ